jgi:hypothetical protein
MEREIQKLEELSRGDAPLDRTNATILNDYLKSILMARKDERETVRNETLIALADDDLTALAREALNVIEGGKDNG